MTDDLRFERHARDWLELGPVIAPADVVQAAFLEIDTTPQERDVRVPWRFQPMPTLARVLVAAAVVIGLFAGGALLIGSSNDARVAGPSPSASTTASPTASPLSSSPAAASPGAFAATDLSATFRSDHYGYSLPINAGWETHQATLTWTGPDNTAPVTDDITVAGGDVFFNGASEAMAPGQTLGQWILTFQPPRIASLTCYGGPPSEWPTRDIGGRTWTWNQGCLGATAMTEAGGRAYVFTCYGCEPPSDPSKGLVASEKANATNPLFDRMLASVQLDPTSVPAPAPPPALDVAFRSDQHGFTLNYPAAWTILQRASTSAPTYRLPAAPDASLDVLGDANLRLSVTSAPLTNGESALNWAKTFCDFTYTLWSMPCDQGPAAWDEVSLADGTAWLTVNGDSASSYPKPDSRLFLATAVRGGRAYEIRLEGPAERSLFLAILQSMQLDPSTISQTWTSAIAGYSMNYPTGWTVTPATKPCAPGCDTEALSDVIAGDWPDLPSGSKFFATSMKLPPGMSFSTWFAGYDAGRAADTCGSDPRNEDITVDGAVGHLDVHCDTYYLEAVIPKGDRAYVFTMFKPFTRSQFESLLATVALTPETAKD